MPIRTLRLVSIFLLLSLGLAPRAAASSAPGFPGLAPFGSQPDAPAEVVVSVVSAQAAVAPGDQLVLAVVFDHAPGWHINLNQPVVPEAMGDFTPIPTTIAVAAPAAATVGPIQWPTPKPVTVNFTGDPVEFLVYGGKAVAFVPLRIADDAPLGSALDLAFTIDFQACDDSVCLPPDTQERTLSLPIVALADKPAASTPDLFAPFDPAIFARAWDGVAPPTAAATSSGSSFFGLRLGRADSALGVALLLAASFAGGLVLNLTPCVLPVLPIKVLTISQHAGSPRRSLYLGTVMAAGVVAFWLFLGVLAASFVQFADPSRLFGYWWFTGAIGLLIGAMGVGIMGLFQITLPQAVYAVNPKADSTHGSFLFGVMTAVLGLPCFGFVAGALLAGSAAMPKALILGIFAALGLGMAAPYFVLSANPKWVDKIPRTGPASELVKQVMGLLLLAAASYFVGSAVLAFTGARPSIHLPWWAKTIHWWAVALFAVAAGGWLAWKTAAITKKWGRRVVFAIVGLVFAAGGVAAAADVTHAARTNFWVPFSDEALADALAADRVVVIDFTAEWCLNCKALKATVLHSGEVEPALRAPGVIAMTADLTSAGAPGWDKLRALGQTGIPTLAVFSPASPDTPWIANAYTPGDVLGALARARD